MSLVRFIFLFLSAVYLWLYKNLKRLCIFLSQTSTPIRDIFKHFWDMGFGLYWALFFRRRIRMVLAPNGSSISAPAIIVEGSGTATITN